jgi:hypothetical protein
MNTVAFAYRIGDSVKLRALNLPGTVIGCMKASDGLQYLVVWYWDGVRRAEWLHSFEVSPWEGA